MYSVSGMNKRINSALKAGIQSGRKTKLPIWKQSMGTQFSLTHKHVQCPVFEVLRTWPFICRAWSNQRDPCCSNSAQNTGSGRNMKRTRSTCFKLSINMTSYLSSAWSSQWERFTVEPQRLLMALCVKTQLVKITHCELMYSPTQAQPVTSYRYTHDALTNNIASGWIHLIILRAPNKQNYKRAIENINTLLINSWSIYLEQEELCSFSTYQLQVSWELQEYQKQERNSWFQSTTHDLKRKIKYTIQRESIRSGD